MLIGFFARRIVTLVLCSAAFWAGSKANSMFAPGQSGGNCAATAGDGQP